MYWLVAVVGALVLTGINYAAHTPLIYIASMLGFAACLYVSWRLVDRFDVPLFFIRRDTLNYWGGAFGGVLGGVSAFYGFTRASADVPFTGLAAELALAVVYLTLVLLLYTGTLLQDIEDGYIET